MVGWQPRLGGISDLTDAGWQPVDFLHHSAIGDVSLAEFERGYARAITFSPNVSTRMGKLTPAPADR